MKIRDVRARWIHCPIPVEQQHVSDFGRISSFDAAIISVEVDGGVVGWGEAKAGVGSSGPCRAVVEAVNDEYAPALVGLDARRITAIWDTMYNGTRAGYALERGRGFPVLGRRGVTMSAMSGIDMALWDVVGKSLDLPVVDLWGGPCTDTLPAYASGGWADADNIGAQLQGYVDHGFDAVKMRVGIMDGDVATSVARVRAARDALGPDIGLMADAHGTYNSTDAMRFLAGVEDVNLRWFEEPVNADDLASARRVRASTRTPIAAGESESTRFDFRELIAHEAADVLQPDLAICGGPTEGRRIAALAETHQLELAPHCWGSALSFNAGVTLAFASSAARTVEYSLGGNPLLREMPVEAPVVDNGVVHAPTKPGFGIEPRPDFLQEFER
ncbi:mandelate racemase/muconate lactonizing enzyme family protein [Ilumatobacter nonamiensis]|uniref:mandelate racemase/muconate lactonizing enzyme family protein n=1 Tax=Ilumatobacter nonamiensis TaxID=467093 RepID=UPI00034853C7|nr:mandelate racemase/muconate lactonizing enzyme family protein [Ilumatobacter nonamiensis]